MTPLSNDAVRDALAGLPGWAHEDDTLAKTFTFDDFRAALAFIVRLGFEAEERDHHPNLSNVYNRVEIALTTHDAGNRVTQRDVDLAQAIERICS
ncbi:MAG: 4a-hydroxytetrahydrobiopterin dehydratase [Bacteroidota bacterium]